MAKRSEFVAWILEQLASLGAVRARAMFGGWGIYADDLFIALVADDVLYLKVDDMTRPRFEEAGATPFVYTTKDGKEMEMSYYAPPEGALEDPEELAGWARDAVAAALRAVKGKAAAGGKRHSASERPKSFHPRKA